MKRSRRLLRAAASVFAGIVLAVMLFLLAAWAGSTIPRNSGWREPASGITIMVESNGTHTGIVMPLTNAVKDWRTTFPQAGGSTARGRVTHIAVGWGEREVFTAVPQWRDLGPLTALRIATTGGESVLRVSRYASPVPGEHHRPLRLTPAQYRVIVQQVEATLAPPDSHGRRVTMRGLHPNDAYYEARGRYTLINTCNNWVGNVLAEAGIRMGWWTPLAGGVMKWIERPARA